jgi:probable F420-dependent oxidoreductase
MKIGMELPQTGDHASAKSIAMVATEAERIGLDSVWVLDRLLRPAELAQSPLPPSVFDPIETLAFAAAHTARVALGTSAVISLPQPPVLLAKRLATLDQLSGGRVIAGLVQGWMPQELAAGGVPVQRIGDGWDDYVGALRAVWGPDPVSYEGRHYQVPPSNIGPKPVRPGGLPVIMGYSSAAGIRRAARIADGLLPFQTDLATLRAHLELFRRTAAEAGRDGASLPIMLRVAASVDGEGPSRQLLTGTLDQWVADLHELDSLGVEHVLVGLGGMPVEEQLSTMAALRAAMAP